MTRYLQVSVSRTSFGFRLHCQELGGLQVHAGAADLHREAWLWAALRLGVQPGEVEVSLVKGVDEEGTAADLVGPPGWEDSR